MLDLKFSMCLICNSGLTHLFLESVYNHQPSTLPQLSWKWNSKNIICMSLETHVNWCKPQQFLQNHLSDALPLLMPQYLKETSWHKNHNLPNSSFYMISTLHFSYLNTNFWKKKTMFKSKSSLKKKKLLGQKKNFEFPFCFMVTQAQGKYTL